MVFSSIFFLFVFLPVFLIVYFALSKSNHKIIFCNIWLLIASIVFYYWGEPSFLIVMISSIIVNYLAGLGVNSQYVKNKILRLSILIFAISLNLGLLFYFKYLDFTIVSINKIFELNLQVKNIILPIGISFFTFQGMSYVIDVYKGDVKVQKNPFYIALYISMFPQLVAGPIVRYSDIEQEIKYRDINSHRIRLGIYRFVQGLFKKSVIANTMAAPVDEIFSLSTNQMNCSTAWLGAIMYTLQIYFDFSGYSDMAIGIGQMLGFSFMENFDLPYISKSIKEFWRRWHISLSSWFRDYLYIPLGGNRKGNVYINLFIVFLMTGLWHGASWNFVIWGIWHGAFLILERIISKKKDITTSNTFFNILKHIYTMFIVIIGWIFFRSDNLTYAWNYLKLMFTGKYSEPLLFTTSHFLDHFTVVILIIAVLMALGLGKYISNAANKFKYINICKDFLTIAGLLICAMFVMSSTYNPFIYFRF